MSSLMGPTDCTRALRLPLWHRPITLLSLVPRRRTLPAADKGAATAGGKVVAAMVTARAVARTGGAQPRWNNPWLTHFARQRVDGTYSSQGETR